MMTDCALAVITESASSVAFARSSTWINQRRVAWVGDGLPHVECECGAHETTIAATAPLGAINELLLREAVAFIL